MLDGVSQDAWQQAHVLALGFDVAGFEQWEMGEDKRDDSLLRLALPLADHPCRRRKKNNKNKNNKQSNQGTIYFQSA